MTTNKIPLSSEENLARLKLYRKVMNVNGKEMAALIGISHAYYYLIEQGRAPLSDATKAKVEEIFKTWRRNEVTAMIERINYLYNL